MTRLRSGSATDIGRVRSSNQDAAFCGEVLFAVADGMGGHAGGEVAARVALETLQEVFDESTPSLDDLVEAVEAANLAVWEEAVNDSDLSGMGSTLTVLALVDEDGEERLAVANVGDSRAYLRHDGSLIQLTLDHSVVEELVRRGEMTPREAAHNPRRHILTRAIGIEREVDVDTVTIEAVVGDRVLLCSDGLSNEVSDDEIGAALGRQPDPGRAARELVRLARAHGGSDNTTVVVVDVVQDDSPPSKGGAGRGRMTAAGGVSGAASTLALPLTQGTPAAKAAGATGRTMAGTVLDDPTRTRSQGRTAAPSRPATQSPATQSRPVAPRMPPAAAQPISTPPKIRRRITVKVVVFVVLVLAVLGGAIGAVTWFANDSYYVKLSGPRVDIYQGRIGGLLWFKPHVVEETSLTTSSVLPSRVADLRNGQQEPSLADAHRYVSNLAREAASLPGAATPTAPTTPFGGPAFTPNQPSVGGT